MKPLPLKKDPVKEIEAAVEVAVKNGYDVQVTLKKEGRKFHIGTRQLNKRKRKEVVVK